MKLLLLCAHADDEVIALWPGLFKDDCEREILCVTNDYGNPERRWCQHRRDALAEVGKHLGIKTTSLGFPSCVYRLPTRRADFVLADFIKIVLDEVAAHDCDAVMTHNPMGEYGHLDHQLVHQIALQTGKPVLYTDIFIPSNWCPWTTLSDAYKAQYHRNEWLDHGPYTLDAGRYAAVEAIYRKHGVWTWSKPPVETCRVYEAGEIQENNNV